MNVLEIVITLNYLKVFNITLLLMKLTRILGVGTDIVEVSRMTSII